MGTAQTAVMVAAENRPHVEEWDEKPGPAPLWSLATSG